MYTVRRELYHPGDFQCHRHVQRIRSAESWMHGTPIANMQLRKHRCMLWLRLEDLSKKRDLETRRFF
jgi:hypothetical protein